MRAKKVIFPLLAYLFIQILTADSLVVLRGRSPRLASSEQLYRSKRQPSTPQDQLEILPNLATPGQQTQSTTSTSAAGNSTELSPEGNTKNSTVDSSDGIDCDNITTGRDNKCWAQLNLTQWVQEWLEDNTCHPNEPFASCFLRLEGFPGLDCTGIKPSACTAPQGDNMLKTPQVFYVAYNIYGTFCIPIFEAPREMIDMLTNESAINQYFFSWWTAVGNAATMASDNVDSIVQLLDPLSSADTFLDDVLISLTAAFSLVPGLGYLTSDMEAFTEDWLAFANIIENVLFTMPQLGRWLFPIDSSTSQVIQMAALSGEMANIIQTVQDNLNKTVVSVMRNATEFLAFASQGNFSESAPSLPDQTSYMLYAFNTYIISQALAGNNIYGVIAQDTNPQDLATNGSRIPYDLSDCKGGYNDQGICDNWWYSKRYSSAFGLDDFSHMNRDYGSALTTLFSNYTTGELLFEGAYACNQDGNYGQPVKVTATPGSINTACLSQLRVVSWDMSCNDPTGHNECEFLEIPRQNQFFGNCGSHSAFDVMADPIYCVPASYLGPLIAQDRIKLSR